MLPVKVHTDLSFTENQDLLFSKLRIQFFDKIEVHMNSIYSPI